jgi:hypothetical protein
VRRPLPDLVTHGAASRRERDRQNCEKRLSGEVAVENASKESLLDASTRTNAVTVGKHGYFVL